jgi:hypothetical protein
MAESFGPPTKMASADSSSLIFQPLPELWLPKRPVHICAEALRQSSDVRHEAPSWQYPARMGRPSQERTDDADRTL